MSKNFKMEAKQRDRAGKGAARAVRREGLVPAVVYGDNKEATNISLDPRQIWKALETGHFYSTVYDISVEGGKAEKALARDVQFHPVSDAVLHVDFMRLSGNTKINVMVAVNFANEDQCIGLKEGGLLNITRHEVELICPGNNIPQELVVDLTNFNVGDTVNFSAAELPKGVTPAITDRDFVMATIAAPKGPSASSDEEGEEGAEEVAAETEE